MYRPNELSIQWYDSRYSLDEHLCDVHQAIHAVAQTGRVSAICTARRAGKTARDPNANEAKKLCQNAARQEWDNDKQKHLDGVPAGVVIDVTKEALDRLDQSLNETGARSSTSGRR